MRHDRVALLGHDRSLGERPFGAHAERKKAYPERVGDGAGDGQMSIEFACGRMGVVERRAGEFELPARLERNGPAAVRVIEADQIAAVLDPVPAEPFAACPRAAQRMPLSPP